ncbi:MAG TPA: hypothetical protein VJU61_27565 [Polyangiaceae bacterium]|nr:hypothetical protein [Polyangiaceae bacterium]
MRHRVSAALRYGAGPRVFRASLFSLVLAAPAAVLGCGEVTEQNGPSLGRSGSGGGGGGGSAGASMGLAGTGGSSAGTGGMGNAVADAGPDGGDTPPVSSFSYPDGCPVPAPTPASDPLLPQKIAIQSFNFRTFEIVLRNISNGPVVLTGNPDRTGWQWCSFPAYWYIAEANVTLQPGQTYKFLPVYNQDGVREFEQDRGELAIYSVAGSFDESDLMLAFVSWGDGLMGAGRENVATLAKLWTFGENVELSETAAGFIAMGPADRASSYVEVPARCLVAPPNPPLVQ